MAQAQEQGKMEYPEAGIVPISVHEENIVDAPSGFKVEITNLSNGRSMVFYPDSRVSSTNKLSFNGQTRETFFRRDTETGEPTNIKATLIVGLNMTYAYSNYTTAQLAAGKHKPAKK